MDKTEKRHTLVVFSLDEQQFSLYLSNVERIIPSMEIHPLPMAPEYILGTINFQGDFLPVINLRKLFLLPQREVELNDQLIITVASKNRIALWVDAVSEIVERVDEEIHKTDSILLDVGYVEGLFKLHDGMVLIHDLDKFLTPEQTSRLLAALENQRKMRDEGRETKDEGRGKKKKGPASKRNPVQPQFIAAPVAPASKRGSIKRKKK